MNLSGESLRTHSFHDGDPRRTPDRSGPPRRRRHRRPWAGPTRRRDTSQPSGRRHGHRHRIDHVGRGIAAAAFITLMKVALELGGKNPQVIFPVADLDPRSDRGADAFHAHRGDEPGRRPATAHPQGDLRYAREPVRRDLHGQPRDEHRPGDRGMENGHPLAALTVANVAAGQVFDFAVNMEKAVAFDLKTKERIA